MPLPRRAARTPPELAEGGGRARQHHRAGADPLQPLGDHQLPFLQPIGHNRSRRGRLAEANAPDLRLVLRIDDVDVIALLIGQHRGPWNGQDRDRLDPFEQHRHELAVAQFPQTAPTGPHPGQQRVGDDPAQCNRVGILGDSRRHIVEMAHLPVDFPGRQAQPDLDGAEPAPRRVAVAQLEPGAQRDGKDHIHRVLADEQRQCPARRRYDIALGHRGGADPTVDRGADFGVAEVDLGLFELGLGRGDLRRQRALGG